MADAIVYDPHCMNMSVEELGKAFAPLDYPQKDFDFQLMIAIGEYANGRGVAFPGMGTLAARLHCFKMDVKRGVDRLVELGFLAVKKVKKKGAKWEHNVYTLAKRFLRKTVDRLAQHFDAEKWKHWVEEKCSARQRRKLVDRLYEQIDQDLEDAGLNTGWWMAMRYMKKHVRETPGEYDAILAEAVQKYLDYDGPNYREIADRPVKRVPVTEPAAPVMSAPAPIQEPAGERVVTVEAVEPEPVDPEPWLQDWDKPIEWEDGSQWTIAQPTVKQESSLDTLSSNAQALGACEHASNTPVEEPASMPEVKPETRLETLPANTESVSAVGSANTANTQSGPIQLDMTNCPKFINGEPSSLWVSQQVLARMNPSMYTAY